jgi:hypothetical protein
MAEPLFIRRVHFPGRSHFNKEFTYKYREFEVVPVSETAAQDGSSDEKGDLT